MYSLLMASMAFWGCSFVWYKMAYLWFKPITVVFFRLTVSSSLLFLFARMAGKLQKVHKHDLPLFILVAFFEPFLYFLGESFGMQLVSSTLASILIATIPLFTPVAAFFLYKEKLSLLNISGIIISLAGVILVVCSNHLNWKSSATGILLISLAVFSAVGYSMAVKKVTERFNPFTIVAWQNGIGALFFLPLFLLHDLPKIDFAILQWHSFVPLLYLTFFASILAFVFFVYGVSKIGVTKANIFTNAVPVFTAIFAWLTLKEELGLVKIAGMAIVLSGIIMSQMSNSRLKKLWLMHRSQE